MNVLLINYEYPPVGGGAGNATMFMARAFIHLGHQAVVITASYAERGGKSEEEGVIVYRLKARRKCVDRASMGEMLSFVAAAWRATPAIAKIHGIQAVIVFFTLPCGPVALRLHRCMGLPYIVSLRGGDVPGLVPEINWQHRLLAPLRRRVLRSARAIVANDSGLARLSEAVDPWSVRVVSNGVDSNFFQPANRVPKEAVSQSRPTQLLFVGRLHRQKNLPLLLGQFSRLRTERPGAWYLRIVGDGPERADLEGIALQLGLGADIAWLGWQDKAQLRQLYQEADALVNPSYYEGMPNVVLEAMACGLPVIASDVPGNNTLVTHEKTGFLFNLCDPTALGDALARIRDEADAAHLMGQNGRNRVQAEYSWVHVAQSYLELLAQPN